MLEYQKEMVEGMMSENNRELEQINQRMTEIFQKWKALQPLKAKDQERFDKKVRLDWNYHSNKIEGNTLTYGETELLLRENKEIGIHPPRDYEEMKAHDLAINNIREFAKDKKRFLIEADIRDLNKIILKEPFWSKAQAPDGTLTQKQIIPGQYKKQPNHVQTATGEIFKFAEPHEVPLKMEELMKWLRKEMESSTLSMASFLGELHHRFIIIHPFDDGNGRVIRLLMNYVLLRFDYPPIAIRAEDKKNYFAALQKADDGDIDALSIYLGKALISWLEIGIKAGKGEDISHTDDIYKEVNSFVMEQVSKGLDQYFSKKSAIYLIDHLSDILFEPFKNNFKPYNEMFSSTNIEQIINSPTIKSIPSLKNYENKEDIKKYLDLLDDNILSSMSSNFIRVYLKILYKSYLKRFFDIESHLILEMNPFKYNIYIKFLRNEKNIDLSPYMNQTFIYYEDKIEDRLYNQILTQEEANAFIEKSKKEFINCLKQLKM